MVIKSSRKNPKKLNGVQWTKTSRFRPHNLAPRASLMVKTVQEEVLINFHPTAYWLMSKLS